MIRICLGRSVLLAGALLALAACSGSSPTNTPAETPTITAPTTTTPTATEAPKTAPQATETPSTSTALPPLTPIPPATETPEPAAALPTSFTQHGFSLAFERGADIQAIEGASPEAGALSFAYGQSNIVMTWLPQGNSLLALVSGTYDLIQQSQPALVFETLADGDLTVDGEPRIFLGFKAADNTGTTSGGLIGSWVCSTSSTTFTLTLTGADAALVQIRFDEIIDGFACLAS
jgi:hypothetical protein